MAFQISAIPQSKFQHLFALPPEELAAFQAVRMVATKKPGFPCRVSLADAEPGEEVILVQHEHQPADSPYRASHAVFVRRDASEAKPKVDETPEMLRSRLLSLRAFDTAGLMVTAEIADGSVFEKTVEEMFREPAVAYIHIHFAKPGCYAARLDRA